MRPPQAGLPAMCLLIGHLARRRHLILRGTRRHFPVQVTAILIFGLLISLNIYHAKSFPRNFIINFFFPVLLAQPCFSLSQIFGCFKFLWYRVLLVVLEATPKLVARSSEQNVSVNGKPDGVRYGGTNIGPPFLDDIESWTEVGPCAHTAFLCAAVNPTACSFRHRVIENEPAGRSPPPGASSGHGGERAARGAIAGRHAQRLSSLSSYSRHATAPQTLKSLVNPDFYWVENEEKPQAGPSHQYSDSNNCRILLDSHW